MCSMRPLRSTAPPFALRSKGLLLLNGPAQGPPLLPLRSRTSLAALHSTAFPLSLSLSLSLSPCSPPFALRRLSLRPHVLFLCVLCRGPGTSLEEECSNGVAHAAFLSEVARRLRLRQRAAPCLQLPRIHACALKLRHRAGSRSRLLGRAAVRTTHMGRASGRACASMFGCWDLPGVHRR